jgi:ArsR family transcriptional regulator
MTARDAAPGDADDARAVFATAAGLFRLLSTPVRLQIISALCLREKNVSQLLAEIRTSQPNLSQHLAALHRAGVLARRREATQVHYRLASPLAASLCRAVCTQVALDRDAAGETSPPGAGRLPDSGPAPWPAAGACGPIAP